MSYTPPEGNVVNFEFEEYSPVDGDVVNFEFADVTGATAMVKVSGTLQECPIMIKLNGEVVQLTASQVGTT